MIDQFDYKILKALCENARISMTDLAERVGLSKTPIVARVRKLEKTGIIKGYRAELSTQALGLEHIAFVEVKLTRTTETALSEFNAQVRRVPEIEECHMIAGGFDYLVKVRTRDIAAYRTVLSEQISVLPYVGSTSTYVSMESVLERGDPPLRIE